MSSDPNLPNPYTPPKAPMEESPPRRGSAVRAVIVGLLIDTVGTLVSSTFLVIAYGTYLTSSGLSQDEAMARLREPWTAFYLLTLTVGLSCSVAGGYVCARIARRSDYTVGWVFSLSTAAISFLQADDGTPLDQNLFFTLITIGAGMWGTRLGRVRPG